MLNGLDLSSMLNGLSLFSGIGGIDIALNEWVRPIAYCEIDPYCQGVLLSRMYLGYIEKAPIWDDVCTLTSDKLQPNIHSNSRFVDIIYGGFPCQGISVAGHGRGLEDERSALFFEILRLSKEIKPKFLFLENVPAITSRGGLQVVKEITELGYDIRWCVISAASIGALHRRERWFLLANTWRERGWADATRYGLQAQSKKLQQSHRKTCANNSSSVCPDVANAWNEPSQQENSASMQERVGRQARDWDSRERWPFESREHWQEAIRRVCRTSDGIPFQVDRIKSLGNAVVPQQAKEAFKILMGLK